MAWGDDWDIYSEPPQTQAPEQDPFQFMRQRSIFEKPVDRNLLQGSDFNPAAPSNRFSPQQSNLDDRSPYKRMFSIPSKPQPQQTQMPQGRHPMAAGDPQEAVSNYMQRMQELNKPTPELTAYEEARSSQPQQSQFPVSKKRAVGAALMGVYAGMKNPIAGYQAASAIRRAPFENAMEEYNTKVGGLKDAATMAETSRTHNQTALHNALEYQRNIGKDARFEANERFNQDAKITELSLRAREVNAQEARVLQPGWQKVSETEKGLLMMDKNGNIQMVNPGSPTMEALKLKDQQRRTGIAGQQANTSAYAAQTGRIQAGIAQTRADTDRDRYDEEVRATEAREKADREKWLASLMGPENEFGARQNALEEMSTEPEWQKFVGKGSKANNEPSFIEAADGMMSGIDKKAPEYQRFLRELERRKMEQLNRLQNPTKPKETIRGMPAVGGDPGIVRKGVKD